MSMKFQNLNDHILSITNEGEIKKFDVHKSLEALQSIDNEPQAELVLCSAIQNKAGVLFDQFKEVDVVKAELVLVHYNTAEAVSSKISDLEAENAKLLAEIKALKSKSKGKSKGKSKK